MKTRLLYSTQPFLPSLDCRLQAVRIVSFAVWSTSCFWNTKVMFITVELFLSKQSKPQTRYFMFNLPEVFWQSICLLLATEIPVVRHTLFKEGWVFFIVGSPVRANHYIDRLVKDGIQWLIKVLEEKDDLKGFLWSFPVLCLSVSKITIIIFFNVLHKSRKR